MERAAFVLLGLLCFTDISWDFERAGLMRSDGHGHAMMPYGMDYRSRSQMQNLPIVF